MFTSPVFYVWLAWLLALAVFAGIRYKARQREEQQREERRQEREARLRPKGARRSPTARLPRSACRRWRYQAAAEPASTPDPAISM